MVRGKESIMCGRFMNSEGREISPSDLAEVQTIQSTMDKIWGINSSYGGKLIINARSETVKELTTFRYMKPCIIPARGYFEWDKNKTKYLFTRRDDAIILLAGVYYDDRFVIITKDAEPQLAVIHHRMPVMLTNDHTLDWLKNKNLHDIESNCIYNVV